MIEFKCRDCQAEIRRADSDAGKTIFCPNCYFTLIVPAPVENAIKPAPAVPISTAVTTAEIADPSPVRKPRDESAEPLDIEKPPPHYAKIPWYSVPFIGLFAAMIPLCCFWMPSYRRIGLGLIDGMIVFGVLGTAASIPLIARSHVRNVFWSNVILFAGILLVGVILSVSIAVWMK